MSESEARKALSMLTGPLTRTFSFISGLSIREATPDSWILVVFLKRWIFPWTKQRVWAAAGKVPIECEIIGAAKLE